MAVDFNLPTVATSYTAFPTQIIENIDAALQQLSVGSPSNVPTNAIKWDATANRWKKYNGSAYVDLTGTYDFNANVSVNQLDLGDSEKIRLGAGQDLQIFHDQILGHSFIKDTGTGNLKICGSTVELVNAANTALLLKGSQGSGGTTSLYQNGDERLKTLSTGVEIFGSSLDLGDSVSLNLGTHDDLKLVHDNANGTIENKTGTLNIKKSDGSGGSQNGIVLEANSDISFYQSTGANGDPQLKVQTNGIFLRGQQLGTSLNDEVIIFDNIVKANNNDNKFQIKHVRDSATDATWQGSATRLQMRVDSTNQGYIQFNGADNNFGIELGTYQNDHTLDKFAFFVRGGKAELYYDNSPKLATGQYGVTVTGSLAASNIDLVDDAKLLLGNEDDFQIYHSGANSIIYENGPGNLSIQSTAGEIQLAKGGTFAHMVRALVDAQVELYHAGNKVLTTSADGIVTSTNSGEGSITIKGGEAGSSALIFHADEGDNNNDKYRWIATDNEALFLQNFASGGWENNIKVIPEGGAFLYFDNTPKLETTTGGVHVTGSIGLTNELDFTGNNNKFVDFETIDNNKYVEFRHFNTAGTYEKFIRTDANGPTEIFYNGVKKIETSDAGATISGSVTVGGNVLPSGTHDLGSSSARWENLYVNDMHFSNEGKNNDIDGSWGDWTLQEGKNNIFMINNRSGKKFKIALIPV